MTHDTACAFCNLDSQSGRIIRREPLMASFVSRPWFREGHTLVIPTRHIERPGDLSDDESAAIMSEIGRLGLLLDKGYGTGVMQKFQPTQQENGVKMNHLHFHVFPRGEMEDGLFPVPSPNSFDGFVDPGEEVAGSLAERLRAD